MNGDLTDYGHPDEYQAYAEQFGRPFTAGIRLYPGLGNHDYANNVDDCFLNHCADRMLTVIHPSHPSPSSSDPGLFDIRSRWSS